MGMMDLLKSRAKGSCLFGESRSFFDAAGIIKHSAREEKPKAFLAPSAFAFAAIALSFALVLAGTKTVYPKPRR
jgi:preprotein translocase subunit Sec61beta